MKIALVYDVIYPYIKRVAHKKDFLFNFIILGNNWRG